MAQLSEGSRQPRNREERRLLRRFAVARRQEDGWDEPYKSRDLRTGLWAAGGAIPLADAARRG